MAAWLIFAALLYLVAFLAVATLVVGGVVLARNLARRIAHQENAKWYGTFYEVEPGDCTICGSPEGQPCRRGCPLAGTPR
jgi:hypothetical protein